MNASNPLHVDKTGADDPPVWLLNHGDKMEKERKMLRISGRFVVAAIDSSGSTSTNWWPAQDKDKDNGKPGNVNHDGNRFRSILDAERDLVGDFSPDFGCFWDSKVRAIGRFSHAQKAKEFASMWPSGGTNPSEIFTEPAVLDALHREDACLLLLTDGQIGKQELQRLGTHCKQVCVCVCVCMCVCVYKR